MDDVRTPPANWLRVVTMEGTGPIAAIVCNPQDLAAAEAEFPKASCYADRWCPPGIGWGYTAEKWAELNRRARD
ncbi:MAG: hypothetical protein ACK5VE_06495 [Alphaproteobacteria bacterium]